MVPLIIGFSTIGKAGSVAKKDIERFQREERPGCLKNEDPIRRIPPKS